MIINALNRYYEILSNDEKSGIPLAGYSNSKVGFALVISVEGELVDVINLKVQGDKGKKLFYRNLTVPLQKDHGVKVEANFMCDNSTYILGIDKKDNPKRAKEAFEASQELHKKLLENATGIHAKAIVSFFNNWKSEKSKENIVLKDYLNEIFEGGSLVFRLDGEQGYIHENQEIKKLWEEYISDDEDCVWGQCLVTGYNSPIARLHAFVKNVKGTKSNSGSLVSFNDPAYLSYGKEQSFNSPISKRAVFAYTTTLNHMLSNPKQKVQIGDATTVFWAESPEDIYVDLAAELFNPIYIQDGKENKNSYRRDLQIEELVKDVLVKAKSGAKINEINEKINSKTKFYVLGLSPNASRISIRFFQTDNFGGFIEKTLQHYKDMDIIKEFKNQPDNIPIWKILAETVSPKSNDKEAKPVLAGAIMHSIISASTYPTSLYNAILLRIKSDVDDKERNIYRINYVRVAIIKAYLLRKSRVQNNIRLQEVLSVGLNEHATNTEYLLGRLFAVLEKAQQDANPDLNSTIKDRYFASACATPGVVFPILMRLVQHHISKSGYGKSTEKRIGEIMNEIKMFPSHLSLDEQGTFVLGYYHQRVKLWEKKDKEIKNSEEVK